MSLPSPVPSTGSSRDFLPPPRSLVPRWTELPLPGSQITLRKKECELGKLALLRRFFSSLKHFFGVLILEVLPRLILEKLLFCRLAAGGPGQG